VKAALGAVVLEEVARAADQVLQGVLAGSLGHPAALQADRAPAVVEAGVLVVGPEVAQGQESWAVDSEADRAVAAAELVALAVHPAVGLVLAAALLVLAARQVAVGPLRPAAS
jgi:hypothetical protein